MTWTIQSSGTHVEQVGVFEYPFNEDAFHEGLLEVVEVIQILTNFPQMNELDYLPIQSLYLHHCAVVFHKKHELFTPQVGEGIWQVETVLQAVGLAHSTPTILDAHLSRMPYHLSIVDLSELLVGVATTALGQTALELAS